MATFFIHKHIFIYEKKRDTKFKIKFFARKMEKLEIQNGFSFWPIKQLNNVDIIAGWWQYDRRTSFEIEEAYKNDKQPCTILVAGNVYIVDFEQMLQQRQNDPAKKRQVKRDLATVPKKGVAGLRLHSGSSVTEADAEHADETETDAAAAAAATEAEAPNEPILLNANENRRSSRPLYRSRSSDDQVVLSNATHRQLLDNVVEPASASASQPTVDADNNDDDIHLESTVNSFRNLSLGHQRTTNDSSSDDADDEGDQEARQRIRRNKTIDRIFS